MSRRLSLEVPDRVVESLDRVADAIGCTRTALLLVLAGPPLEDCEDALDEIRSFAAAEAQEPLPFPVLSKPLLTYARREEVAERLRKLMGPPRGY